MRLRILFAFLLAFLPLTAAARACDLCGCPVIIDGTSSFYQEGFSLGLSEQFTRFGTLQQDGNVVRNPYGEHINSSFTQLYVNYNFDNRLGLQLNVPYIHRTWQRRLGHTASAGSASGLGDMSLQAHYLILHDFGKHHTTTLNLYGGLEFPTGSPGFLAEEASPDHDHVSGGHAHPSGVHGHDLTFGSGSVDGIVGANFFWRQDRFFVAASLQYAMRTRGAYGYQFANDFLWSAGPGIYLDNNPSTNLKLRVNVSGEVKGLDNLSGTKLNDTGITSVFIGPQIMGNLGKSFYVQAGVDIPLSISNTDLQIVPDYRLNATVNCRF